MRIGVLISCANSDAQILIDTINKLCLQHDAKLVFAKKSTNEIRIVEKIPEEI